VSFFLQIKILKGAFWSFAPVAMFGRYGLACLRTGRFQRGMNATLPGEQAVRFTVGERNGQV
jgi:hypothetical protein